MNVVNLGISTLNVNIYTHIHTHLSETRNNDSLSHKFQFIFDAGAWITHLEFTVNQFLEGGVSCAMRPLYRGSFNVCKKPETDNLLKIRAINLDLSHTRQWGLNSFW